MSHTDLRGRFGLGQTGAFAQTHSIIAEIRLQPITHLGGAFDRFAVDVQEVAPFLRFQVGHPDGPGRARQVGFADAHSADLVVVCMAFLELA